MPTQIDIIMAGLDHMVEAAMVGLTYDLVENLTINTPVDLGWARAGWVPNVGQPWLAGGDLKPDPALVAAAQAVQQEQLAQIANYRLAQGPIFVVNNVVYIERLNEGWSLQAPAGFVQTVVAQTIAFGDYGGDTLQRSSFNYRPGL